MEILDLYLEQFDTWRGAQGIWTPLVVDRCLRNGGTEDSSKLPVVASVDSTNDLMFQHAAWHGEQGGFLEPVYTWSDSDRYGLEFLEYHRDLVATYDEWRVMNGYPALVPWDPSTPIPDAYAYAVAAPCLERESEDPQVAMPSFLTVEGGSDLSPFWEYTSLCEIPDANRLGKTIEDSWYHAEVHLTIGGDMAEAGLTLRDPIFWPWHVHVQGIYDSWMACPLSVADPVHDQGTNEAPGFPLATPVLATLGLAWARRQLAS